MRGEALLASWPEGIILRPESPPQAQRKMDSNAVRREILAYLSTLPKKLRTRDTNEPEIALALGNCLVWVSGLVESGPAVDQPLTETPTTIHALGKQFCAVAIEMMDHRDAGYPVPKEVERLSRLSAVESCLDAINTRLAHLDLKGGDR